MLGRARFMPMRDTLNSLLSPYYCMAWLRNIARNLKVARIYIGVTYLGTSLRVVNTVQCNDCYWFKSSFIPCAQSSFMRKSFPSKVILFSHSWPSHIVRFLLSCLFSWVRHEKRSFWTTKKSLSLVTVRNSDKDLLPELLSNASVHAEPVPHAVVPAILRSVRNLIFFSPVM